MNFNITLEKTDTPAALEVTTEDNNLSLTTLDETNNLQTIKMSEEVIIKKGYSPFIGPSGTWFEYDNEKKAFVDTGVVAGGGATTAFYNRFEFPNVGKANMLYIAKDEKKSYIFNEEKLIYECIGSDYEEIKIIQCGLD